MLLTNNDHELLFLLEFQSRPQIFSALQKVLRAALYTCTEFNSKPVSIKCIWNTHEIKIKQLKGHLIYLHL